MAEDLNMNIIQAVIKIRREKEAYYKQYETSFVPEDGELCLVDTASDGLMMKVGDGISTWDTISYFNQLVLQGYYDSNTKLFWADQENTTLMDIKRSALYIDLRSGNRIYYYNGTTFVLLAGGSGGGSTEVDLATASTAGIMKLYDNIKGTNIDGTVTQKAIYEAIKQRIGAEVDEANEMLIIGEMGEGPDPTVNPTTVVEYIPGHDYLKDTIVYFGDRIGICMQDFIANDTLSTDTENWNSDIDSGNILVNKIGLDELDNNFLKALSIYAFVTKRDIPTFNSEITIAGSIPTFRDGTHLSTDEKKGCGFFYIIDANNDLVGIGRVLSYNETTDEFTCNAIKYGAGSTDNILHAYNALTNRGVGEVQTIDKDTLLNPKLIIKSTPPTRHNFSWFESNSLDSSEITPGMVPVKQYNENTNQWDITVQIPIRDSDVVKNSNGLGWDYFRIYQGGNVYISLSEWQLVFDENQVLGKITKIDQENHEITIMTIHANDEDKSYLEESVTATSDIGGIATGDVIDSGTSFTDFAKLLLAKPIPAEFSLIVKNAGVYKVGDIVNGVALTATINKYGSLPIKTIQFWMGNVMIDEQNFVEGTEVYSYHYDVPVTTNTVFAVLVDCGDGVQSYQYDKILFVNPIYVGTVGSLNPDEATITALRAVAASGKDGTYIVTMEDNHTCYAYPAPYGYLTEIKDSNNFGYLNSFTRTMVTINSVQYYVYTLTEPVTASDFTWTFV